MTRVLVVVLALGWSSCSAPPCSESTCEGCCDSSGVCRGGTTPQACGASGQQCGVCAGDEVCSLGRCFESSGTGGGGGGAMTGGGGGAMTGGGGGTMTGGGGGTMTDAGTDAGVDAGIDAGTDAGFDAGTDAGIDAGIDAGVIGGGVCAGTLALCGSTCRDLEAELENCGACGNICTNARVCTGGSCELLPTDCSTTGCPSGMSCDPTSLKCIAGCRVSTDCPMGAACSAGQCRCPTGQHACGQVCTSNNDVMSCGSRCAVCPSPASHGAASCASGTCTFACQPGYRISGSDCVDIDECATNNGGCGLNATCTNTAGSFSCTCFAGYGQVADAGCVDVDSCASGNGGCDVNATCVDQVGHRACLCKDGYVGDGLSCARVTCGTDGGCVAQASCTPTSTWPTCACPAGTQGTPTWACVSAATAKDWQAQPITGPRGSGKMVYDSARARFVLMLEGTASQPTQLWEYDRATWTQRTTTTVPTARKAFQLVYDSVRSRTVLFGGYYDAQIGPSTTEARLQNDTWEYDGTNWSLRTFSTTVPPKAYSTGSWDPARGRMVLLTEGTSGAAQTWEYDGTTWTLRSPATSPSFRSFAAMTWDPVRNVTVLHGGYWSGSRNDTWTWNGTTWTQVSSTGPTSSDAAMVFDTARQRAVLLTSSGATWEWDGATWQQLMTTTAPDTLSGPALAYDAVNNEVLTVSTYNTTALWRLRNLTALMPSGPSYAQASITANCESMAAAVELLSPRTSPPLGDDATTAAFPLPFPFAFFGAPVTHASVQTNGMLQLYANASGTPLATPSGTFGSSTAPNSYIAPHWRDLHAAPTGRISWRWGGMPGRRYALFEWGDLLTSGGTTPLRMQARLYDTNVIELHYCPLSSGTFTFDSGGLESATATISRVPSNTTSGQGVRFVPAP